MTHLVIHSFILFPHLVPCARMSLVRGDIEGKAPLPTFKGLRVSLGWECSHMNRKSAPRVKQRGRV